MTAVKGTLVVSKADEPKVEKHTIAVRGTKLPPFRKSMVSKRTWRILTRIAATDLPELDSEEAALLIVEVPYQMHCLDILDEWSALDVDVEPLCQIYRNFFEALMTRTRNSYAEDATARVMDIYLEHEYKK